MCQSKFTETKIASILKAADVDRPVNEISRVARLMSCRHEQHLSWRFDQLRVRAGHVLRVQEEQGVVRLQDNGLNDGRSWETPRTLLMER